MCHPEWILTNVCHSDSSAALLFHVFFISCSCLPLFLQKCHLSLPEKQCGLLWRNVLSQPWSRSQRGDLDNVTNLPGYICRKITAVLFSFLFSQYGNSLAMAVSLSQSLAQNLGIQWDPASKRSRQSHTQNKEILFTSFPGRKSSRCLKDINRISQFFFSCFSAFKI